MAYIEHNFPIEGLNKIAQKEGNAKKPIYQMHKRLPRQVKVEGLDRLLLRMQDRDSGRFLLRLLSDASDSLMRSGFVILFPVAKIGQNVHPKLVVDGNDVRFYHIFSKGLRPEDVGYFRCPFTIS